MGMDIALQIFFNGILTASFYALVGTGLSFIYSTARIFHLAHGAIVVFSGYIFWWGWIALGLHPVFAALMSFIGAGALGVLMNEYVYEVLRQRGTRGLGYLIASLGLLMLGNGLILLLFGSSPKTFQFQTKTYEILGVTFTTFQFFIVLSSVFLLGFFYWLQKYTKFGKAMRAVADNEMVAETLGIKSVNIRRLSFFAASLLAAPAGIFFGLELNLDPNMGILIAVFGFAAMVIGGVGSFLGPIAGAVFLGVIQQIVIWYFGAGWKHAVIFLLLFLFLLTKPSGIFGQKVIK